MSKLEIMLRDKTAIFLSRLCLPITRKIIVVTTVLLVVGWTSAFSFSDSTYHRVVKQELLDGIVNIVGSTHDSCMIPDAVDDIVEKLGDAITDTSPDAVGPNIPSVHYVPLDSAIGQIIGKSSNSFRRELLERPFFWHLLKLSSREWWIFVASIYLTFLLMLCFSQSEIRERNNGDSEFKEGARRFSRLFAQDFMPVAIDVDHGRFVRHSYRGAIHWFRDVSEKFLAIVLILVFDFYLAKASGYFISYASGDAWRLVFLPLEINALLAFSGWFLIIDGLIQTSAMFDAPGVSRTIDSLIVILAGFVVMIVEAFPGEHSLVSFTVGHPSSLAPTLSGAIGLLFCVRAGINYWHSRADIQHSSARLQKHETDHRIKRSPLPDK
jgi:hypothetical protein